MERAAFSYSLTGVIERMSNPMYDEYERLVVVADHLQHRIDSYGQEIEDLLNLVYRDEVDVVAARRQLYTAAATQAEMSVQLHRLRLEKAMLARCIEHGDDNS